MTDTQTGTETPATAAEAATAADATVTAVTATGTTDGLSVQASGGSRADLGTLLATNVMLDVSGGSNATVSASGTASGCAARGSHVTVLRGGKVGVDASGGSSVSSG